MKPHVHIGVVEFATVAAYVVIFTFLWRAAAATLAEKHPNVAAGMAGAYS